MAHHMHLYEISRTVSTDWLFPAVGSSVSLFAVGMGSQEDVLTFIGWASTFGFAAVAVYQRFRQVRRQEAVEDERALHGSLVIENADLKTKNADALLQLAEIRSQQTILVAALSGRIDALGDTAKGLSEKVSPDIPPTAATP